MADAEKKNRKRKAPGKKDGPEEKSVSSEKKPKAGTPGWVTTFADLMSLLMCFFVMLVSMAWSTFWLDPDAISDRLNVSFVGILTIVAYQFVVIDNMPRNSYLTFTDILLLISFFITSLTIPHSLYVKSLTDRGKKMMAQRLDRICRWAFPLGYAAGIFLFLALYKLN